MSANIINSIRETLSTLRSHITWTYHQKPCGVDPLSLTNYPMWYGDKDEVFTSVDDVLSARFFDGKTIEEMIPDMVDLDL